MGKFDETNALKKGTRIVLKNGWKATLMDNKKGSIRLAEVEGFYTEIGSIYAADIAAYKQGDFWIAISNTHENLVSLLLGAANDE